MSHDMLLNVRVYCIQVDHYMLAWVVEEALGRKLGQSSNGEAEAAKRAFFAAHVSVSRSRSSCRQVAPRGRTA